MRSRLLFAVLFVTFFAACPASADSLFTLSGDLTDTGSFLGTLRLTTSGEAYVQGTYTHGAQSFTLPPNYLGEQLDEGTYATVDVFAVNASFDLFLIFPQGDLAGYAGGSLCAIYSPCGPPFAGYSTFDDGTFVVPATFLHLIATPATTPEPASLALLGTGTLAVAAILRRRSQR